LSSAPAPLVADPPCALSLRNVSKRFGAVRALDDVSLDVRGGEIHGLLGQNGCGKSTLVKVLSGFHAPDAGEVAVAGERVSLPITELARHGVAVIHQDLGLGESMTVTENMGIGLTYDRHPFGVADWRRQRRLTADLLREFDLHVGADAPVSALSPSERAVVAVARAVRTLRAQSRPNLFILDEPTAYIPSEEAAKVLAVMRRVAAGGAAVIFVSHRLDEVFAVTERISVLRDGRLRGTVDTRSSTRGELMELMFGEEVGGARTDRPQRRPGAHAVRPALRVGDLHGGSVRGVSFDVGTGEVVGLAGLVGMGHDELPYLIAGAARATSGSAVLADGTRLCGSPARSFAAGVVLVPSDRRLEGVWEAATAGENVSLVNLRRYRRGGRLRRREEAGRAAELLQRFHVQPPDASKPVFRFSGGNQQKIVLAKWLQDRPRVVLLAEPTQGVDVRARTEIHGMLRDMASKGAAIVVSSSDGEELEAVCDRVLVFRDGSVCRELRGLEITQQAIAAAAAV